MAKIKAWTKEHYILIMAAAIWLLVEFMVQSTTGDEPSYQAALQFQTLSEYIKYYFETWSNRILIDVVAVMVLSKPMVLFKIINAIVFFFLLYGIKKLLLKEKENKLAEYFLISLFFIIPYTCFLDAGFSVTCIYYLWPAAAGIWTIYIVLKEQASWPLRVAGALLLIFSCNMEQTALLMNAVLFLICCHCIKSKRRSYPWLMFLVAIGCILFMLLGAGGNHRVKVEIGDKFPEYISLTMLQKFDMGFSTTMEHLIMESDPLWIIFVTFLFLILLKNKKDRFYLLGVIPFVFSIVFGLFKESMVSMFPPLKYMLESVGEYGVIDLYNYDLRNRWITLAFFFFVLVTVIVGLYLLEDDWKRTIVLIFMFGVGFLSRLIMGFSPTIYASGNRTYYPFWIVLIGLIFYLFQKFDKKQQERATVIIVLVAFVSVCSVIVSLNR